VIKQRRRLPLAVATVLTLYLAAAGRATAADASPSVDDDPIGAIVQAANLFTDDDLMLFEVASGPLQLSEGLGAYSSRAGVFLPVGELSRLVDLAISVDPQIRRADGWVVSEDRRVRIDLRTMTAQVGEKTIRLGLADAAFRDGEIYVRTDKLEEILPIRFKADPGSLVLTLTPTEPLPFQQRMEREEARNRLTNRPDQGLHDVFVPTPYRAFTPPSFDLNLNTLFGNRAPKATGRYDLRASGDLAGAGVQLFAGSDTSWRLSSLRIVAERKDPDGRIAGPFGARRSSAGDTYTPGLSIGARSSSGRGFAISSAPLEQASVFDRLDLRGELPLGYEVELYVNEVLQGSQSTPIEGRYEFPDVNLAFGLNTIRLVFYGPRGERREDVRRLNVGGGQLAKGETVYSFGAVQDDVPVFPIRSKESEAAATPAHGKLRVVASLAHGVTSATTVSAGVAQYTPSSKDTRQVATAGLSTTAAGFAVQADGAADSKGGAALAIGAAGRIKGVSIVARESEYSGGFVDEVQTGGDGGSPLRRNTSLSIDSILDLYRMRIPVSFQIRRDAYESGDSSLSATARVSRSVGRYLISSAWSYDRYSGATSIDRLAGAVDASALVDGDWQLRGALAYDAAPKLRLTSFSVGADRNFGVRNALHLGISHAFDGDETELQAAQTWHFDVADVSIVTSYNTRHDEARVGLQLSTGLIFDPLAGRYRALGPGAAAGGSMAVNAFIDANGDGRRQPDEKGVPDVVFNGSGWPSSTDKNGHAMLTRLGDGASARVQMSMESLDDPYLQTPGDALRIVPRPGRVASALYPISVVGEVELQINFVTESGAARGLSALDVELVDAAGVVAAHGRTGYDGTALLERLRPGTYELRLESGQAARLGLELVSQTTISIPADGGFAGRVNARVARLDRAIKS